MNFEQGDSRIHKLVQGKVTALIVPGGNDPPYSPRRRQPVMVKRRRNKLTWNDSIRDHDRGYAIDLERKCAVIVREQKQLPLGSLTAEGTGFASVRELKHWWQEQGRTWSDDRLVWLVRIQPDRSDRPRFVARGLGYTESLSEALLEEDAESVPEDMQDRFSGESALQKEQRRIRERIDRGLLSTEERVRHAREAARTLRVDVTRQEARLMDALKANDRGKVVGAIESIERKLRSKAA